MTEYDDLREIVGRDVGDDELARLRRAHDALRSVPAPPPVVPRSLDESIARVPSARIHAWSRPRVAGALALAAALAAAFVGVGAWLASGNGGFDAERTVAMHATASAPPNASALIRLGAPSHTDWNYTLELNVSGLPQLPRGGYYVLWLAKGNRYAATCGTFNVGRGTTEVYMNVSYDLSDYDAWVVTAVRRGESPEGPHPWLLRAPTESA